MIRAYAFASGHIDFGRSVPAGATVIARGPDEPLRRFIGANARTLTRRRGRRAGTTYLMVPGMPEATSPIMAVQRLSLWCERIAINPPAGVRVLPR